MHPPQEVSSRKAVSVAYIVSCVPAFVDGVRALLAGFLFPGTAAGSCHVLSGLMIDIGDEMVCGRSVSYVWVARKLLWAGAPLVLLHPRFRI